MEENLNETSQEVETPLIQINEGSSGTDVVPNSAPNKEKEPKKKGKTLKLIIGLVILLVAIAVAGFFYLKSQRTANKYIDTKLADVKNSIEESYSNETFASIGTLDLFSEDVIANGTLKLKSSGDTLNILNGTELNFNLKGALSKEYLEATLNLKDEKENVGGSLYLDNKNIYFDVKDVTNSLIKIESQENIFDEIKESLKEAELDSIKDLLDLNTLKDFSLKTIDFLGEALKETSTSTKQKGMNIEYIYEFNNDTLVKALNKYIELVKGDSKYSDTIKKLTNMEDISLNTSEISIKDKVIVKIEVNMLTNKLDNLTIVFNDKTILSKVGKDQYKLIFDRNSDKNYALLTIKDEEFKAVVFRDDSEYVSLELISKKKEATLNIEVKPLSVSASMNVKEVNKNETKISINADLSVTKFKLDSTIKLNNGKLSASGSLTVDLAVQVIGNNAESITLEYNIDYEHGKDIVSKTTLSNAKSLEQLSESDYESMNAKLEEKMNNSNILSILKNYFVINDYDDEYYDIPEYEDFDY